MEKALFDDLHQVAEAHGTARATLAAAIVAAAHGFTSPFVLDAEPMLRVSAEVLQEYRAQHLHPEHGALHPLPEKLRVPILVDDALADLVDQECDRLGMDYSAYIRSLLRRALGHSLDPAAGPAQGQLELEGVAS